MDAHYADITKTRHGHITTKAIFAAPRQFKPTIMQVMDQVWIFSPHSAVTRMPTRDYTSSMTKLCVSYCRVILQVYQVHAFSLYMWFSYSYYGPLQCVYLTLIYLHCFKDRREIPLARYCVDEIIEHNVSHYQVAHPSSPKDNESEMGPSEARMPLAVQVLINLHSRLDSHLGSDNHSQLPINAAECSMFNQALSTPPFSSVSSSTQAHHHRNPIATARPSMISVTKPRNLSSNLATESFSGLDLDVASIVDLNSWSSSLVLEYNDILAHPDPTASE